MSDEPETLVEAVRRLWPEVAAAGTISVSRRVRLDVKVPAVVAAFPGS